MRFELSCAVALFSVALASGAEAAQPPSAAATTQAETTQAEAPGSALVRMTLVAADIERSKRFYAEVFGYSVRFDGDITSATTQALLNLGPRDRAMFVVLEGPSQLAGKAVNATSIGLLAVSGSRHFPSLGQPRGNRLATGQAMMAVQTVDMSRVLEALRRWHAPILAGPVVSRNGNETEIVTQDPDGTRIHVVERR